MELDELALKLSADGMIHTVQPIHLMRKKRDLLNEETYEEASVCLTCPLPECSGDRKCYLRRKKQLEAEKNNERRL